MPAAEYHTPKNSSRNYSCHQCKIFAHFSLCFFVSAAFAAKPGLVDGTRIPGKWGKRSVFCLQLPEWVWVWFSRSVVSNSCDPVGCSLPGSSVHEVFEARRLEWVAVCFSSGSFPPRNQTWAGLPNCRQILY